MLQAAITQLSPGELTAAVTEQGGKKEDRKK